MSAIFGIISKYGKPIEPGYYEAMKKILKHRAVDGEGFYQKDNAFLGHYKLITNIYQKTEQQPLEEDNYVIIADARIDNRDELIKILEIKLTDVSDAYLILMAYHKWQENSTNYLLGEFVFLILNKTDNTFFCATDHIGFRSFYYYDSADFFIFSTELKGITALDFIPKIYNEQILVEYFSFQRSNISPYKNIYLFLNASQLLLNSQKKLVTKKYWDLKPSGKYTFKRNEDWPECLRELMFDAVGNRINTDLPVGIQLSGGLDSSFVGAIASKILKEKNRQLISISSVLPPGYTGAAKDEQFYINALVNFLGNVEQCNVSLPEGVGLFTDMYKTLNQMESFGANGAQIIQRYIFDMAKQKKVNILLTGLGGDVTISNNGDSVIFEKLKTFKLAGALKLILQKNAQGFSIKNIIRADIFNNISYFKELIETKRLNKLFLTESLKKQIFLNKLPDFPTYKTFFIWKVNNGNYGKPLPLAKNFSSYFNLEYSNPIYDKKIIEFFADLPAEQNMLDGKERSLIRRAMAGLVPPEIYNRTDKQKFLPDYADRFRIDLFYIGKLLLTDGDKLKNAGINVDALINAVNSLKNIDVAQHPKGTSYPQMMQLLFLYHCFDYFFDNK